MKILYLPYDNSQFSYGSYDNVKNSNVYIVTVNQIWIIPTPVLTPLIKLWSHNPLINKKVIFFSQMLFL